MADLVIQTGINGMDGLTDVDGNMPEVSEMGLKFHLSRDIHTEGYFPYRTMARLAHLTNPANGEGFEVELGVEHWIGFAVYLEGPWEPDSLVDLIFQIKGIPDRHLDEQKSPLNPILPLRLKNNGIDVIPRGDSRAVTVKPYEKEELYNVGDYDVGDWMDFVIRYFPSYGDDGIFSMWINNIRVVLDLGMNCFNDVRGPALDFGLYKPHWKTGRTGGNDAIRERTLYIKNIRVAIGESGYNLVDPSQDAPLPEPTIEERLEITEGQLVELASALEDQIVALTELQMMLTRFVAEIGDLQSTQLAQDSTIERILKTFREFRDLLQNWLGGD